MGRNGPDVLLLTCGAGVFLGLLRVRRLLPLGLALRPVGAEPAHRFVAVAVQ